MNQNVDLKKTWTESVDLKKTWTENVVLIKRVSSLYQQKLAFFIKDSRVKDKKISKGWMKRGDKTALRLWQLDFFVQKEGLGFLFFSLLSELEGCFWCLFLDFMVAGERGGLKLECGGGGDAFTLSTTIEKKRRK